jgi:hypothetical protein
MENYPSINPDTVKLYAILLEERRRPELADKGSSPSLQTSQVLDLLEKNFIFDLDDVDNLLARYHEMMGQMQSGEQSGSEEEEPEEDQIGAMLSSDEGAAIGPVMLAAPEGAPKDHVLAALEEGNRRMQQLQEQNRLLTERLAKLDATKPGPGRE